MAEKINSYSKETIRARMLQNAVDIWGFKSINSIDPFVRLLIDAFSEEIFKINSDVQFISKRILEKLARMLTPSMYTAPQPAHAVAFTYPIESVKVLPGHTEFFIRKAFPSSVKTENDKQINISYTPVDNVQLVKMRVSVLFAGDACYTMDGENNKIPIARFPEAAIARRKIFVGIDATDYINENLPRTLAFYCSNPTFEDIEFVYKLLPFITVKTNGKVLKVSPGLHYEESEVLSGYEEIFREYSIKSRLEENIKNIYKEKFIEISGIKSDAITETLPEALSFVHGNSVMERALSQRMIWLEMEFPPRFTPEIIENFSFLLNTFPIINRGWKSNTSSPEIMGNNIPLSTAEGEHFLYVDEVIDDSGNQYQEIPFTPNGDLQKGLYTLRYGGMERFDERNALDMIDNVLELTRDEVTAFSILNRDMVKRALSIMVLQMKGLNQQSETEQNIKQEKNYVIVEPVGKVKLFKGTYWVSNGALANHIRIGTTLKQTQSSTLNISKDLTFLTETTAGGGEQRGTDAIQAYKYALTTRDKIISLEDVKNFCRMVFKNGIKEIEVRRGTAVSDKPKEGFIRTVEVEIVPESYASYGKTYWDSQALSIKKQIASRAIDGLEYVVKIINKDDE